MAGYTNPLAPPTHYFKTTPSYDPPRSPLCLNMAIAISGIALFIIGCLGIAGVLPGPTVGWVTVGLGGGMFCLNLAAGNWKQRRIALAIDAVITAIFLTIGALGITGVLSAPQVGWSIFGISTGIVGCKAIVRCCIPECEKVARRGEIYASTQRALAQNRYLFFPPDVSQTSSHPF